MKLDLTKPVRCKNGLKARIIRTDADINENGIKRPVVAFVQADGGDLVETYTLEGEWNIKVETGMDLINID